MCLEFLSAYFESELAIELGSGFSLQRLTLINGTVFRET